MTNKKITLAFIKDEFEDRMFAHAFDILKDKNLAQETVDKSLYHMGKNTHTFENLNYKNLSVYVYIVTKYIANTLIILTIIAL